MYMYEDFKMKISYAKNAFIREYIIQDGKVV